MWCIFVHRAPAVLEVSSCPVWTSETSLRAHVGLQLLLKDRSMILWTRAQVRCVYLHTSATVSGISLVLHSGSVSVWEMIVFDSLKWPKVLWQMTSPLSGSSFFFSLNAAWRLSWLQEHLIILLWRWWWCSSEAQSTVREALGLITFNLLTLNAHLPMMSDGSFSYAHRVSSNASWRVLDPTVVSPSTECLSVWNIL